MTQYILYTNSITRFVTVLVYEVMQEFDHQQNSESPADDVSYCQESRGTPWIWILDEDFNSVEFW